MAKKDVTDLQVLQAYLQFSVDRNSPWPDDILREQTGMSVKVCCRAMVRAVRRGLVEYGVSLRAGWITDDGHKLLTASSGCSTGSPDGYWESSAIPFEHPPQRFRWRSRGYARWKYGCCVHLPSLDRWTICTFGLESEVGFDSDPWEVMGVVVGDAEAFEWLDNDLQWIGDIKA